MHATRALVAANFAPTASRRRRSRAATALSLAQLYSLPQRTQITRHDCVEGWSAIGKWSGVPLLRCWTSWDRGPMPATLSFAAWTTTAPAIFTTRASICTKRVIRKRCSHCGSTTRRSTPIMARPLRLRIPTQLGYKSAKWIARIELVGGFATINGGKGGYWEDQGYDTADLDDAGAGRHVPRNLRDAKTVFFNSLRRNRVVLYRRRSAQTPSYGFLPAPPGTVVHAQIVAFNGSSSDSWEAVEVEVHRFGQRANLLSVVSLDLPVAPWRVPSSLRVAGQRRAALARNAGQWREDVVSGSRGMKIVGAAPLMQKRVQLLVVQSHELAADWCGAVQPEAKNQKPAAVTIFGTKPGTPWVRSQPLKICDLYREDSRRRCFAAVNRAVLRGECPALLPNQVARNRGAALRRRQMGLIAELLQSQMTRGPARLRLLLLACFTLAASPSPQSPPASPGPLKAASCRIGETRAAAICGTLTVFENRATRTGRTIGIHFIVIKAAHSTQRAIAFNPGGPGVSATAMASDFADTTTGAFATLHQEYDLLLVDNRGTGESAPTELRFCAGRPPGCLFQPVVGGCARAFVSRPSSQRRQI